MEDVGATRAAAVESGATGRAILRVLIVMALLLGQLVIRARATLRRAERARTGRSRGTVARTRCGNTPNAAPSAAAVGASCAPYGRRVVREDPAMRKNSERLTTVDRASAVDPQSSVSHPLDDLTQLGTI